MVHTMRQRGGEQLKRTEVRGIAAGVLSLTIGCGPGLIEADRRVREDVAAGDPANGGVKPQDSSVAEPSGGPQGPEAPTPSDQATPPRPSLYKSCSSSTVRGSARPRIRRLSKAELQAALEGVLGSSYFQIRDSVAELPDLPETAPGESYRDLHIEAELSGWIDVAVIAGRRFSETLRIHDFASNRCLAQASVTPVCWSELVARLGSRVLRRPLTTDEKGLYEAVTGATTPERIARLLTRLLISPDFVFHMEYGEHDPSGGRVRLTAGEVANRIAFQATGLAPDEPLRAAVEEGRLVSLQDVEEQTRRLLDSASARTRLHEFVREWLLLSQLIDPPLRLAQAAGDVPGWSSGQMSGLLENEVYDFIDHVVWSQRGSYQELLTLPVAVPREPRVAAIYGTSLPAQLGDAAPAPNHPGLIARAALLAGATESSSPILRGVKVRKQILCDILPSPNFDVVAQRLIDLGSHDAKSMANWKIVEQTTADPQCMGCHASINPVGFTLEEFDSLGRHRGEETVMGVRVGKLEVQAVHDLPGPQSNVTIGQGSTPRTIDDTLGLANAIADSDVARACMGVRLFRNQHQRAESDADACALSDLTQMLLDGAPIFDVLVRSIANEDIFWGVP
jgi:hypothetical protein